MNHDQMIEVIQAHKEGKKIRWHKGADTGICLMSTPKFDFMQYTYEIEPEPLECWVNVHGSLITEGYKSKEEAINARFYGVTRVAVHMREVV